MKLNKILLIVIIVVALLLFGYFALKSTKSNDNNVDIHENPIISLVIIGQDYITIKAGMYAYGDIVMDGVIDKSDIKFVDLLLNSKLSFSDSQKLIADLNHDGKVDNEDLDALKQMLGSNEEIKYNVETTSFEYGISTTGDSSGCKWQDSNKIENITYGEYYAFVRIKNTNKVSLPYKFTYEKYEEEEE